MDSLGKVLRKNKDFVSMLEGLGEDPKPKVESAAIDVKDRTREKKIAIEQPELDSNTTQSKIPKDPVQEAIALLKANGMEVAKPKPESADSPSLMEPTIKITSEDLPNGRFYHLEGDDNLDNWKASATTQLSIIRLGTGFDKWNQSLGPTADKVRDAKAQKGSDVHHFALDRLVYGEEITIDDIKSYVHMNPEQAWKWLYATVDQYVYAIRRQLASFCQFWIEHQPIPVACEYPIYHPDLPFGGRLDLIVEMKKAKNSRKLSRVMVDLKTGNKYKTHVLQNSAYKLGWELMNPDKPIDYIACLYVSDGYRDEPKYDLHYQKEDYQGFIHASRLWHRENSNVKGELRPSVKKRPPTVFNLYNKTKTEDQ